MRDVQVLGEKREKNNKNYLGNYIYVDTKTKNNKNYLLKNNLNNFRANQLPGATRKTTHSVNKYINPIFL